MTDTITLEQQLACAVRELGLRKRLYPKWIAREHMTTAKAAHELACQTAIVETLRALVDHHKGGLGTMGETRRASARPTRQVVGIPSNRNATLSG